MCSPGSWIYWKKSSGGTKYHVKSNKCDDYPKEEGNKTFDAFFAVTHFFVFLFVFPSVHTKQNTFDPVTVDNAEDRLGTCPSAPYTTTHSGLCKDEDKQQHQQERHQVEFLHIERDSQQLQTHMVKGEEEHMYAVYRNKR